MKQLGRAHSRDVVLTAFWPHDLYLIPPTVPVPRWVDAHHGRSRIQKIPFAVSIITASFIQEFIVSHSTLALIGHRSPISFKIRAQCHLEATHMATSTESGAFPLMELPDSSLICGTFSHRMCLPVVEATVRNSCPCFVALESLWGRDTHRTTCGGSSRGEGCSAHGLSVIGTITHIVSSHVIYHAFPAVLEHLDGKSLNSVAQTCRWFRRSHAGESRVCEAVAKRRLLDMHDGSLETASRFRNYSWRERLYIEEGALVFVAMAWVGCRPLSPVNFIPTFVSTFFFPVPFSTFPVHLPLDHSTTLPISII